VNNFDDFSKNLIKILDDMRTTQDDGYARNLADGISALLIPLEFDKNIDLKIRTLSPFTNLPLIDQFIMFERTVTDLQLHGRGLRSSELALIDEINNVVDGSYLKNILGESKLCAENINENYKKIIALYTIGEYKDCITEINLVSKHETILPLIEIYVKSHIYLNREINDDSIYSKLAYWLMGVIKCDRRAGKFIDEFELLAAKIYFNVSSSSLLFILYNLISNNNNKLNISRKNLEKNGSLVTSSHLNISVKKLWDILEIKEVDIPSYRQFKFKDLNNLSFEKIKEHYFEYERKVIIQSEFLKDYTRFLLDNSKYELAVKFIVDKFLQNPASYYYFPIYEVVNILATNMDEYASIEYSILIDIYIKNTSNVSNELLLESYENLVESTGINRPSAYYSDKQLNSLEFYFLKFI
ncbi:hypothetical protein ACLPIF_21245, partial [Providencia sp. Me1]|uniref:hypothetical protein n=1 Tax=Providencia sp. Me1 TaxID=3392634 RepID=UPI003D2BB62E